MLNVDKEFVNRDETQQKEEILEDVIYGNKVKRALDREKREGWREEDIRVVW